MSDLPLQRDGWTLETTDEWGFAEVMTWFPNAAAVDIWGGPKFRYPFTADSFLEDCRPDLMQSYCLRDDSGHYAAFGQSCERDGRGHLARLIVNPDRRRRGGGSRLIEMIIALLEQRHAYAEYSLFVYRHNEPALKCYSALGFVIRDYPEDAALQGLCYFMTRARKGAAT